LYTGAAASAVGSIPADDRADGKFTAVVIGYLVCFGLTLAGTAILSALVT
jgi:hypothetical protein